jgi:hypothetical protein
MSMIDVSKSSSGADHFLDSSLERVFFIANNPDICIDIVREWHLSDRDVVVQFNRPQHFRELAAYRCHKVHFHNRNRLNSCWGFSIAGEPECDITGQEMASLTFATTDFIPAQIGAYLDGLRPKYHRFTVAVRDIALFCYPSGKLPSAGFTLVSFFRTLNWLRIQTDRSPMRLTIFGFTGLYSGNRRWSGHDFGFEQAAYRTWLDIERLDVNGRVCEKAEVG